MRSTSRGRFFAGAFLVASALMGGAPARAQEAEAAGAFRAVADERAMLELYGELAVRVRGHLDSLGVKPSRRGLFALSVDEANADARVSIVDRAVPGPALEGMGALVAEVLARRPAGKPLDLVFRLAAPSPAGGDAPRADSVCVRPDEGPELANRRHVERVVAAMAFRAESFEGRRQVILQGLVDENGELVFAYFTTRTGDPEVDMYLNGLTQELKFRPGRLDGKPVPTWIVLPVNFIGRARS